MLIGLIDNPFIPEFLVDSSILEFGTVHYCIMGFSVNSKTMANSVDPNETAYYELSHLDLHCLHSYVSVIVCRAERVNADIRQIFNFLLQ